MGDPRTPHPAAQILGRFYHSTYERLLGVNVAEADLVGLLDRVAGAFHDDPGLEMRLPFAAPLAGPLSAYMGTAVQPERFEAVAPDLVAPGRPRVLDFGCGDASALRFLGGLADASLLVGVDPIHDGGDEGGEGESGLNLVPTLDHAARVAPHYDLVCAMYTLHHMTEEEAASTIPRLAGLLAPNGRMFLVEDNPSFEGPPASEVDNAYLALTEHERLFVLELNDFWANVVVHRRAAHFQHYSFRSSSEWIGLFTEAGLEPVTVRSRGFNFERLHGVPTFECVWRRAGAS